MVITRISTYNTYNSTIGDATSVQGRLYELQKQISSGVKTDQFRGLYGEVEAFTALEDKMARSQEFIKNNAILSARMNLMDNSLGNVTDTVTELRNTLLLRRNGTAADSSNFSNQLEQLWARVSSELNADLQGRHLFGGIRTDQPPVNSADFPSLYNDENLPEAGYYQGSSENVTMRLNDAYEVPINVRADNLAIQQIYAGFATAMQGHDTNDDALLGKAFDLLSDGLKGVSLMQVEVGTIQTGLIQSSDRQNQQLLYWRGIKDSMISTDLVAASTEVSINQGILQASFQAFARINSLQLSDFLR